MQTAMQTVKTAVALCPSCHEPEDLITMCKRCGHRTGDDEPVTVGDILTFIAVAVGLLILLTWIAVTLCEWMAHTVEGLSLVDILKYQWQFVRSIKVW